MKRQSTDWKNIFANDATNNNLISKIYKQLIQFNNNSKKLPDNPVENWAEDLNRHFSIEDKQMAFRHVKRCSKLLVIRGMQIKTTVSYPLTTGQTGHHQKPTNNKCQKGSGEKGTLLRCWWECKLV